VRVGAPTEADATTLGKAGYSRDQNSVRWFGRELACSGQIALAKEATMFRSKQQKTVIAKGLKIVGSVTAEGLVGGQWAD
jgi:hypothetical protein